MVYQYKLVVPINRMINDPSQNKLQPFPIGLNMSKEKKYYGHGNWLLFPSLFS